MSSNAPSLNLSPPFAGRGRRVFAAGEGLGTALIACSAFADRKSPSPHPSPRKCGEREHTALGASTSLLH
jgi:hypothetical protein